MSADHAHLFAQAAPHVYTDPDGKSWPVSPLTNDAKAKYVQRLKGKAREALAEMAGWVPDRKFRELAAELAADMAAGEYRWGGNTCNRSLSNDDGSVGLVAILFGVTEDEARAVRDRDPAGVLAVVEAVAAEAAAVPSRPGEGGPKAAAATASPST